MGKEIRHYDFTKKPRKASPFWMWVARNFAIKPRLKGRKVTVKKIGMTGIEPPYLLFVTHASMLDFPAMYTAVAPHNANNVVAIDAIRDVGDWIMRRLGCICKRKFVKDLNLIRNMRYCVDKYKSIVCIYPEARYTLDGTTGFLPDSLGKMSKLLKVPAVVLRLYGTFVAAPQWNKDEQYLPIMCELECVATAEEVKKLSADELNAPGRISQTTAQALLARAYLWQSGYPVYANTWNEALTYARKVRDSGLHQLNYTPTSITTSMPEYTIGTGNSSTSEDCKDRSYYTNENSPANGYCSLFINMCSNLYDTSARESMFEVEFYGNGLDQSNESGKVGLYNGIQNSITTDEDQPFAYAWYDATKILVRLYNKLVNDPTTVEEAAEVGDRDARKWWNVSDYTFDTSSGSAVKTLRTNYRQRQIEFLSTGMNNVFPGKWRAEYDPIRPWARNNGSINFPVMRYSDVLLMIAEASNEIDGPTQEAIDAINEVRERAGAISMSLNDFPDQATLRQFIFEERTRELCFEVPRHMELRRMGRDFFFTRIRMLQDQSLYISNQSSSTIGYPTDNVRSVPARNLSERHIYLPIPQSELNVNTICGQNEGW